MDVVTLDNYVVEATELSTLLFGTPNLLGEVAEFKYELHF